MYDTEEFSLETPESFEMERTEVTMKETTPKVESLRSKLLSHYKKGMKKPDVKILSSPLTPDTVNRIAVPMFLFTILATFKIGLFNVMPLMYEGQENVVLLQQAVVLFLFAEIMMNWLGIRYADSSYNWFIRKNGDPRLKTLSYSNFHSQQLNYSSSTSSSVLMTLVTEDNTGSLRQRMESAEYPPPTSGSKGDDTDPGLEAERANEAMNRERDQINSKSINDLIQNSQSMNGHFGSNDSGSMPSSHPSMHDSYNSPQPTVSTDGKTVIKSYPYWSWVPCYDCDRARPPRCHHCPVCRTCILKRDHHCFFAGTCVGYRNHRFFFVFLIYAWIGCAYATLHGFPYIFLHLWGEMSILDILFPISFIRFLIGYVSFQVALSVTTLTLLLYFDVLTLTFAFAHGYLIYHGTTSFEKAYLNRSLEIKDTRNLKQKIRAVMGPYWALNFLFPTNILFEPEENPVTWPYIEVYKH